MTQARMQEAWRVFVNLYFRNLRVLRLIFVDQQKISQIMEKVKLAADVEGNSEMSAKIKEIETFNFDQSRPLYILKKPFDE